LSARPGGILIGLEGSFHLFSSNSTYRSNAHLPIDERVAKMREPEVRERIPGTRPATRIRSAARRQAAVYCSRAW
jgi:hypothetical protein